jgi:hypothetical protein
VDFLSWKSGQEAEELLGNMAENAMVHEELSSLRFQRREFYGRMLRWTTIAHPASIAQNLPRFWAKLGESRARAAKYGLWQHVMLTKVQADTLDSIIRSRLGWKAR